MNSRQTLFEEKV